MNARALRLWWMRRYELPRMRAAIEQLKEDHREQHPDLRGSHAIYCDECERMECVHCHDFNADTSAEVDVHAVECADRDPEYEP